MQRIKTILMWEVLPAIVLKDRKKSEYEQDIRQSHIDDQASAP